MLFLFGVKHVSRPPRVISRGQVISRTGSGYLERSGYLEGSVEITRASRWLGPLRTTRSAQDDSVRYESSHVARHCKDMTTHLARAAVGTLNASKILTVTHRIHQCPVISPFGRSRQLVSEYSKSLFHLAAVITNARGSRSRTHVQTTARRLRLRIFHTTARRLPNARYP